jgi:hypothetical protein
VPRAGSLEGTYFRDVVWVTEEDRKSMEDLATAETSLPARRRRRFSLIGAKNPPAMQALSAAMKPQAPAKLGISSLVHWHQGKLEI